MLNAVKVTLNLVGWTSSRKRRFAGNYMFGSIRLSNTGKKNRRRKQKKESSVTKSPEKHTEPNEDDLLSNLFSFLGHKRRDSGFQINVLSAEERDMISDLSLGSSTCNETTSVDYSSFKRTTMKEGQHILATQQDTHETLLPWRWLSSEKN